MKESVNNNKKIAVALSIANTVISAIVSITYIPILLSNIGKGEYGLYQLIGSIIAYFSSMYTSLNASVMKYYTEYLIKNDEVKMENTLAISRRIFIIMSIIVVIISLPITFLFKSNFFKSLSEHELNEALFMFRIMIINIIVYLNGSVYSASILANEKFVFRKLLDLIITILQPISVLLMIKKYPYASTIVVIQLIMNIFLVIVCLYYSKRELNVKIKYHFKDDNLIRGIFGLSASVLLISIADQIFWKTDQIILGWLYGTETVAVYSIGSQFNSIFISTGVVITGVIVPMITRLNETPDKERKLSEIFTRIGRYQAYLVLLMLTGVILFGKEFIFIIAGKDFAGAYYVALLLMIPYSIDLIQSSGNVILLVKNKNWYKARILFISAILNVFLTFFFSKKYGMYGAALATTVSIIMASWIFMNRVYLKVIRLDIKMFWKNVIPIFGYAILSLFVGILIKKIKMSNFYIEFISHVMMYTISYFIIIFSMAMNSDEKNYIFGKIKKFI